MEKVSVIIPVYNAENHIEKCVNSILNQTYRDIEIILVNDGSRDNSLEIIKKFDAIIIDKKNGGASSARNEGLKHASGDFIMFVDSDDYLDKECIADVIGRNADIVRFKICYEYPNGKTKIEDDCFEDGKYIEKKDFKREIYSKMLTGIQMNSICRTLYKKSVIKDIRFNETLETAEDLIFNINAFSNADSFMFINKPYYHYLQTNEGLTGVGISVVTKYRCNFVVSYELLSNLKLWGMNELKYQLTAIIRPFIITLSKLKRVRLQKCIK